MNMTKRADVANRHRAGLLAGLVCAALAGGCASSDPALAPDASQATAIDTGTYPNLNIAPQPAAEPLSAEDKSGLASRLGSAKGRQAASGRGAGTSGDPEALKRLAASHGEDTLKAIAEQ